MDLFYLEPRGVGTQDIESLDSYLYRYASLHGVTTNKFIERCFELVKDVTPIAENHRAIFTGGIPLVSLIRPNKTTWMMLHVLKLLTGSSILRSCTLISLMDVLDRDLDVYSSNLRWCPACVSEFESSNDQGYFKLIWQLKLIKHCPIHHVELREKCYSCGRIQNSGDLREDSTSCIRCGASLSQGVSLDSREPSWAPDAPDLVNLVEEISHNPHMAFQEKPVKQVLSWLFNEAWKGGDENQLWKIVPRDLCLSIVSGHKAVSLATAREIAIMLNVRLVELLHGVDGVAHESFNLPFLQSSKPVLSTRKRRNKRNRTEIHEKLRALLNEERNPPYTLNAISDELGVSTGYMRYQFQVQTTVISEKYQKWREYEKERKRLEASSEILKALVANKGQYVSKKALIAEIMEKTGLPKNVLRYEYERIVRIYNDNTEYD